MAVFIYKASGNGSETDISGTIAADTAVQARDLLRERGLIVRDISDYKVPATKRLASHFVLPGLCGMRYESTTFIREVSTLLAVGVPLLESLDTIARQHTGKFHTAVVLLRDRVAAGASLAQAMREQPTVFDDLCVNITEVGEDAGTLDASLERLAEFRERSEQIKGRGSTALIYPAIVSIIAVFCSIFLMTFVIPKILEPLIEQGLPLPFPTRVVKGISDFLLSWWWALAIVLAGAIADAPPYYEATRAGFAGIAVLQIPLLGDLVRKQAIVRIAVVLGTLLKAGVVFVRSLQIAQRTTSNLVLRDALHRCETAIVAGREISEALEQTGAFPPMVVQVFALGQQSGRLEEMLERLATTYDREVNSAAQRMAAIIEPLLIVVLALVVLFIVLATVLPILEAGNAIQ